MKELSIEDKAKRFDKGIEKLRNLHDNYDTISTLIDIKEELENIFPELKVSDSEKIRKEIIEHIKDQQSSFISAPDCRDKSEEEENNKYNSWIAWLEKQGEQKPQRMVSAEAKEAMYNKPTWSEEDENMLQSILNEYKSMPIEKRNWLKSLRPQTQWKPSKEQMEGIECAIKTLQHQLNVRDKRLNSLYDDLKQLMEE